MHIRFPRLMALARRMMPGVFEEPQRLIGACVHCGRNVTYAAGDTDAATRPRHDSCEKAAARQPVRAISADRLFMQTIELLRVMPDVRPPLRAAVAALPERYGPKEMLGVIAAITPHVETSAVSLTMKRDVLMTLRGVKRDLSALAADAN